MTSFRSPTGRVVTDEKGLWCRRGAPPEMISMHRHNDVEVNVVLRGELRYVFAGRPLVIREGQTAVFWAAQPHGLVDSRSGESCWVHVPLATVMGWALPEAEIGPLLRPRPLVTDSALVRDRFDAMSPLWIEEIARRPTAPFALLEIQAAVRRIVRAATDPATAVVPLAADPDMPGERGLPPEHIAHTMAMAQHVMDHFREPLPVEQVASAVHLAPSHAMTVFRRTIGVTVGDYVTMCRVAEAQRLLITTAMTAADIALASGFGSLSSFYHHVTAACGMTPREYRRQAQDV
jgi:AraC-like DNA-binding protein